MAVVQARNIQQTEQQTTTNENKNGWAIFKKKNGAVSCVQHFQTLEELRRGIIKQIKEHTFALQRLFALSWIQQIKKREQIVWAIKDLHYLLHTLDL